ncbi:ABC transporter ATP-binding protein [Flavobacterium sp. JP2137]|uniref:ABC transporter ATP-binding protein n=1 Tax=Flavobacterium sp. JP2137 TaxID=3414510 RepID=UPI003D300251
MSSPPIIHIEKLYKQYKEATTFAIHNLNLAIDQGEIYGLLGPNGAGKTSLIAMLCGLLSPTSGSMTLMGWNYGQQPRAIKSNIGVVPQEYALYPTLTARENLMYFGSMYGLKGKILKERVTHSLEVLGLTAFADKRVETFSGGMKRRVNLIAGVLHQPKLLFLDEPTVGVDVQSKTAIIQFLQQLNALGTTIIYTSHHLVEAQEFCTKIGIIDQGQLFVQGTPNELIAQTAGAKNLEDVFLSVTGKTLRDVV